MNRRQFILQASLTLVATAFAGSAVAQGVPRTRPERAYRDDLLTNDERGKFQQDMRNARTDRQRESIRKDYRGVADQRAPIVPTQNVQPYRAPAGGWPGSPTGAQPASEIGVPGAPVPGMPQMGGTPVR